MTTIIVGRNGKETVRTLASATESTVEAMYTLKSGRRVWRTNFEKQRVGYRPNVGGVAINWALQSDITSGDAVVYNAEGICKASNKPLARRLMAEAGVPIPETTDNPVTAFTWVVDGYTVIQRPVQHHGGLNFTVLRNTYQATPMTNHGMYYQKFFRKTKEFRAHVAHGKILIMQEKVPNEEVDIDYDDVRPWNHATGDFIFNTVKWSDFDYGVCRASVDATSALRLDFGAVDILWNEEEGAVVCEVNTSPALAEYATERYTKYFKWLGRSDSRRGHFDSSEFTTGKDFAWRNRELADECGEV